MSEIKRLGPDRMTWQCMPGEYQLGQMLTMHVHKDADTGQWIAQDWKVVELDRTWIAEREHVTWEALPL